MHAALAVLLGRNSLRVSEACGAHVNNLGFERGHRTLQLAGKGNKPAWSRSSAEPQGPPSTTGDDKTATVTPPTP